MVWCICLLQSPSDRSNMSSNSQPALHPHSLTSGGGPESDPGTQAQMAANPPSLSHVVHVPYQQLDYEETDLGMIFGRYSVVNPEQGPIARGGDAAVYKASVDASAPGAATHVAVKVVEKFIRDERKFEDNSKELAIHSLFSGDDVHPHIVTFLFGNEGSLVFQRSMEKWKSTRGRCPEQCIAARLLIALASVSHRHRVDGGANTRACFD